MSPKYKCSRLGNRTVATVNGLRSVPYREVEFIVQAKGHAVETLGCNLIESWSSQSLARVVVVAMGVTTLLSVGSG